jgi:hypothetical protein
MKYHFPAKSPRFGRKTNPLPLPYQQASCYFWWWEYLRRNQDYKKTCENGGKGKCTKLYQDFGDVYSVDFRTWFNTDDRGQRLFAEPHIPDMKVVTLETAKERMTEHTILVTVPLNLTQAHLLKTFRSILNKHHEGERGVRVRQTSQAKYQLMGKEDTAFLEMALAVWDMRQAHPDMALWEIANETRCVKREHLIRAEDRNKDLQGELAGKKNILAATASRYVKKANAMIENVGKGFFPAPYPLDANGITLPANKTPIGSDGNV